MKIAITIVLWVSLLLSAPVFGCQTKGQCKVGEQCEKSSDCSAGLWCPDSCPGSTVRTCSRSIATNVTAWRDDLPFNKYSWLTTHNAYAYGSTVTQLLTPVLACQDDSIAEQLNGGVRALMLDFYPVNGSIWECHSPVTPCTPNVAFRPALDDLIAVADFLTANPREIVTLILEDYTPADGSLTRLLADAGLSKLQMPLARMPSSGSASWPTYREMVASGWRLLIFTSDNKKQAAEGIPYLWNFMLENQYGTAGMNNSTCINRRESAALSSTEKSLVINNWFLDIPSPNDSCTNPASIALGLAACSVAQDGRWANYVAVDFYKRSMDGQPWKVLDTINGKLICGCDNINMCEYGASSKCYGFPRAASEPCNVVSCKTGLACEAAPGNSTKVCTGTEVALGGATSPPGTPLTPASAPPGATTTIKTDNSSPRSAAHPTLLTVVSTMAAMMILGVGLERRE